MCRTRVRPERLLDNDFEIEEAAKNGDQSGLHVDGDDDEAITIPISKNNDVTMNAESYECVK